MSVNDLYGWLLSKSDILDFNLSKVQPELKINPDLFVYRAKINYLKVSAVGFGASITTTSELVV